MDSNLQSVARRVSESYKWLSQCGLELPPDKVMELATNMAIAASIKDVQDSLSRVTDNLNYLDVRINGRVELDEPIRVSVSGEVKLQEPISVCVDGNVSLYEPISVNVNS